MACMDNDCTLSLNIGILNSDMGGVQGGALPHVHTMSKRTICLSSVGPREARFSSWVSCINLSISYAIRSIGRAIIERVLSPDADTDV